MQQAHAEACSVPGVEPVAAEAVTASVSMHCAALLQLDVHSKCALKLGLHGDVDDGEHSFVGQPLITEVQSVWIGLFAALQKEASRCVMLEIHFTNYDESYRLHIKTFNHR